MNFYYEFLFRPWKPQPAAEEAHLAAILSILFRLYDVATALTVACCFRNMSLVYGLSLKVILDNVLRGYLPDEELDERLRMAAHTVYHTDRDPTRGAAFVLSLDDVLRLKIDLFKYPPTFKTRGTFRGNDFILYFFHCLPVEVITRG